MQLSDVLKQEFASIDAKASYRAALALREFANDAVDLNPRVDGDNCTLIY